MHVIKIVQAPPLYILCVCVWGGGGGGGGAGSLGASLVLGLLRIQIQKSGLEARSRPNPWQTFQIYSEIECQGFD